jgi:multidrug efflux pump subunit AcrA (membrane-fusion protein)
MFRENEMKLSKRIIGEKELFTIGEDAAISSFLSFRMVETHRSAMTLAVILVVILLTVIACLVFVPWQQTVHGRGAVSIFSPMQRSQHVSAQIDGILLQWHVMEGDSVRKGDLLIELTELNPRFLDQEQIHRMREQRNAVGAEKKAIKSGVTAMKKQIKLLNRSADAIIPSVELKVQQAVESLQAARQKLVTAELNLDRRRDLFAKGLNSSRDMELAELAFTNAQTGVEIANREVKVAQYTQTKAEAEINAKIQDSHTKLAKAEESYANVQGELLRLDIDIAGLENRLEQRKVRSPVDGEVVRLFKLGRGVAVKAGEELALIFPTTHDLAVELYVSDLNAPLVSVGRTVRLQFSGWPAMQFSGWPSIAVGTFAGRVAVIDSVAVEQGHYRVMVIPDWELISSGKEVPWPQYPYLRQGAQAKGWIMLDTVSLGFELWRQFNAFPPVLKEGQEKLLKLPKVKMK